MTSETDFEYIVIRNKHHYIESGNESKGLTKSHKKNWWPNKV